MKVTFADYGPNLASSRLRASIPQATLERMGIQRGTDVLVYGKHWLKPEEIAHFGKKIYDVCDDHFSDQHRDYYISHCLNADAVTCNSRVMKEIIYAETGVVATVINEPYEGEEATPDIGSKLFWFGHASNLHDLTRLLPSLTHPVIVMSNKEGYTWTPENFARVMSMPLIVVIPTGKSMAKSENRMVESIRRGRYVCAEYLPAYEPFYQFFPCGDIPARVEEALANPRQALERIKAAQEYIRDRYSPETVAKQWVEVIHGN